MVLQCLYVCGCVGRFVRAESQKYKIWQEEKYKMKLRKVKIIGEAEYVAAFGLIYIYCSAQKDLIHFSNISYINCKQYLSYCALPRCHSAFITATLIVK